MVKSFETYQQIPGEPMTRRDKQEVGSKFWNQGKWDNFVLPFISDDCEDMTLVDVGCNAGLFLKLAKDKGFRTAIGIDANGEAVRRGVKYRDSIDGDYEIRLQQMEECIDKLPMSDYTILANVHYYFYIHNWLQYLDKLISKTRYCIIITSIKRDRICEASASTESLKRYFKQWKEPLIIPKPSLEGDPFPRHQWSLCFKSPLIERVQLDSLSYNNHIQDNFYKELDDGIDIRKTQYYIETKQYRRKWTEENVFKHIVSKKELYEDVKKNGLFQPLIIDDNNKILEGNHRCAIMKHLGYKTILIRRT